MNRSTPIILSAAAVIVSSSLVCAGVPATFEVLPSYSTPQVASFTSGVSADGKVVYGINDTYGTGWIWSSTLGLADIGGGRLCGASGDGSKICGLIGFNEQDMPGIWRLGPDWLPLGGLPQSTGCGQTLATPFGMSRDGTVVAGLGWGGESGCSALPFKWTQAAGMTELPMLDRAAHYAARINAVSGNGQTFGGWEAQSDGTWRPVMWLNGQPHPISSFECDCGYGEVLALNYGGSTAIGYEFDRAFIWKQPAGLMLLPNPIGAVGETWATAISDNSRVIVGHYGIQPGTFYATIWIDNQPTKLQDYLAANGATGMDGLTLWAATGVSADGTVVVGTAREDATFRLVPFRATIAALAPACAADTDGSHSVGVTDLLSVITHWGSCPTPCSATCAGDIVKSCSVDVSDLLAVITSWGACPTQ